MYKHLIVPLDGSALAEAILPLVDQLARKMQARVTLLHVLEANPPQEVHGERHLTTEAEAVAYLEQVKEKFFSTSVEVRAHVHETGVRDVAQSIVAHATEFDYDLIAICTHGSGGLTGFLFGSIAQQVLNLGRTPVLVLYPHKLEKQVQFDCINLLVPLDGDPEHERGFRVALKLAETCAASLHLLMVIPTLTTLPGEQAATATLLPGATKAMLRLNEEMGQRYLQDLVQTAGDLTIHMTWEVLRGDPARAIVEAAKQAGSDMIVMGTHSKSSMDSFWSGSLTPQVARRSHVPLLLVPVGEG
jgi:nucleotide-binding universal stress UspA family protein